jgi:hypothetical protein
MALKSPANGRDRSIATESRCPHDVRSSLNFRHNVVASRASIWAITRHPAGSHQLKVWRVNAGRCSIEFTSIDAENLLWITGATLVAMNRLVRRSV